jgi:hypothetical protein
MCQLITGLIDSYRCTLKLIETEERLLQLENVH